MQDYRQWITWLFACSRHSWEVVLTIFNHHGSLDSNDSFFQMFKGFLAKIKEIHPELYEEAMSWAKKPDHILFDPFRSVTLQNASSNNNPYSPPNFEAVGATQIISDWLKKELRSCDKDVVEASKTRIYHVYDLTTKNCYRKSNRKTLERLVDLGISSIAWEVTGNEDELQFNKTIVFVYRADVLFADRKFKHAEIVDAFREYIPMAMAVSLGVHILTFSSTNEWHFGFSRDAWTIDHIVHHMHTSYHHPEEKSKAHLHYNAYDEFAIRIQVASKEVSNDWHTIERVAGIPHSIFYRGGIACTGDLIRGRDRFELHVVTGDTYCPQIDGCESKKQTFYSFKFSRNKSGEWQFTSTHGSVHREM
jgi:hypothetical protein